jgi:hypothetical protein
MLKTSPPSMSRLSIKCGSLDVSQPHGPSWSATGVALPFFITSETYYHTSFQDPELGAASAAPSSYVCSTAMLLLLIVGT